MAFGSKHGHKPPAQAKNTVFTGFVAHVPFTIYYKFAIMPTSFNLRTIEVGSVGTN